MEAKGAEARGQMDRLRQFLQQGNEMEAEGAEAEGVAAKGPEAKGAKARGGFVFGGSWIFFIFLFLIMLMLINQGSPDSDLAVGWHKLGKLEQLSSPVATAAGGC